MIEWKDVPEILVKYLIEFLPAYFYTEAFSYNFPIVVFRVSRRPQFVRPLIQRSHIFVSKAVLRIVINKLGKSRML